jgi:hypothetical protein
VVLKRRGFGLALLLGLFAATSAQAEPPHFLDYIYVDANEGGSSGGHVALRIGEDVFHYEYHPAGILVPRRQLFEDFRYQYGALENRTIELVRVPVGEAVSSRVLEHLSRRHLIRSQQLAVLEQVRADRQVLGEIIGGVVELDGAALFDDAAADGTSAEDAEPVIQWLRHLVEEAYGAEFLDRKLSELRRQLTALTPDEHDFELPTFVEDRAPALTYSFPQRYRDALTALAALEVLRAAPQLARSAILDAGAPAVELREPNGEVIGQLLRSEATSLLRLLRSERPDWGFPLLLGMARLAALDRSRRDGRWVFLDGFPPDAPVVEPRRLARSPELLTALAGDAYDEFASARSRLRAAAESARETAFPEADYARFEEAGQRFIEARRALVDGKRMRVPVGRLVPARPGAHSAAPLGESAWNALARSAAAAEAREQAILSELRRLYPYHLITRNCVSELFQEMETAHAGDGVKPSGALDFIPFVSAISVEQASPDSDTVRIPSTRRAGLAKLYETGNPIWLFFRESNTITSTLYHRNPHDSFFLFFTDDFVVTRPIFGTFNVLAGLGATAVGLALLPFDGGATALSGLRGIVFSLPELLFQNIRKGSFELAPRR